MQDAAKKSDDDLSVRNASYDSKEVFAIVCNWSWRKESCAQQPHRLPYTATKTAREKISTSSALPPMMWVVIPPIFLTQYWPRP